MSATGGGGAGGCGRSRNFLRVSIAASVFTILLTVPVASFAQEESEPPLAPAAADDEGEPPLLPADTMGDEGEPPLVPGGLEDEAGAQQKWHAPLNEFGITGSLRGAYWSSNRLFDDEQDVGVASAWLKLDKRLVPGLSVFVEGYVADQDVFDDGDANSRLREAYVNGRTGDWDYRIGKQIVAWGRTDRLNPTDNLTPRDFTLLAPEIDEDRFGSEAVKVTRVLDRFTSVTGIWIANFRPNVVALPAPPGVLYQENIPDSARQWALKLDQSGKDIDWSVSYFDGIDLNADPEPGGTAGGNTIIRLDHHRVKVVGADAATTHGAYRYATEVAYTRTEDADGVDPTIRNPFLYLVVGIERDFGDNLNAIVQGFYRHVENYSDPEQIADPQLRALAVQAAIASNQYDESQYGLSVRIGKKWWNETLEGELAGSMLLNRSGYVLRPKLIYILSDSFKFIAGAEYYHGSDKTTYGLLEKNRAVFTELRYFF